MSSEKRCEKHCRLKFKVSKGRLIRLGKINRSLKRQRKLYLMSYEINISFAILK